MLKFTECSKIHPTMTGTSIKFPPIELKINTSNPLQPTQELPFGWGEGEPPTPDDITENTPEFKTD